MRYQNGNIHCVYKFNFGGRIYIMSRSKRNVNKYNFFLLFSFFNKGGEFQPSSLHKCSIISIKFTSKCVF